MGGPSAQRTANMAKPPDGGWGWFVVFGSFMIHVFADGVTYSFGVFFEALVEHFKEGQGATSWINSILVGVTLGSGPISSALVNRWNCRVVTIAGAIVASAGLALSMFAQNIFTLYITVGIITGLGLGLIYLPAIVCVTCYFEKYRSLATGIAVCGSGIGTFIMAPIIEKLVSNFGWRWAFLDIAGLMLTCIFYGLLFRPLETPDDVELQDVVKNDVAVQNGDIDMMNGNKRPHSIHGGQVLISSSMTTDKARLALSQPMLTIEHRRNTFGSGVMYRKDVLYSGSLAHIPQHHKSASALGTEVKRSEEKPLMGNGVKTDTDTVVCGCIPCAAETSDALTEMLDMSLLKDPLFIIFTISNFCTSIGFNVPYVYMVTLAKEAKISDTEANTEAEASYLLAIVGIANTIGRIVLGYVSDKPWVNRLYIYNISLTICGLSTALSVFCFDFYTFAIYAFMFGFTAGAYVGLTSVVLVDLLGLDKLTNAFGLLLLFQGLASLVGPPITGWLYDATSMYSPGFIFSGVMIAISGLMLFVVPYMQTQIAKSQPRNRNGHLTS